MCDRFIVPCKFDSVVMSKSKLLRMHTCTTLVTSLLQCGEHDKDSYAHVKSKYLKVQQLQAIRTGVRIAPSQTLTQSARMLRRNLSKSQSWKAYRSKTLSQRPAHGAPSSAAGRFAN